MNTTPRQPMHLVDDEVLTVGTGKKSLSVRVRVWRAKDEPAVVLVEQLPGGRSPSLASCKIARVIWRDLLKFSPLGMHYFETEGGMLWRVTFDTVGQDARAGFIRPSYEFFPNGAFDTMSGRAIFGDPRDMAA